MDIRNKNPRLFRAFGFRPIVEKCSLRAAKSYICSYRSVLSDCSPLGLMLLVRAIIASRQDPRFPIPIASVTDRSMLSLVKKNKTKKGTYVVTRENIRFFLTRYSHCFLTLLRDNEFATIKRNSLRCSFQQFRKSVLSYHFEENFRWSLPKLQLGVFNFLKDLSNFLHVLARIFSEDPLHKDLGIARSGVWIACPVCIAEPVAIN